MNPPDRALIFIVGTQRSGTTLLRLILNAHSQIAIPEEARFLAPLLKRKYLTKGISGDSLKRTIRYLALNDEFKLWNYDASSFFSKLSTLTEISLRELIDSMFSSFCTAEGKTYWGDKSLFFDALDILNSLFPTAHFIHIVRDGRDVFDSWRKMEPTKNNAAVIALDWSYKLYRIERSFKHFAPDRQLTIRYEDLIDNPERTIKWVCAFVGVEYEPKMLEFHKTSHYYIGDHHSSLIHSPISNLNRAKWRKNLTRDEAASFSLLAQHYLKKYGYETQLGTLSLSDLVRVFGSLTTHAPRRLSNVIRQRHAKSKALKRGEPVKILTAGSMPRGRKANDSAQYKD